MMSSTSTNSNTNGEHQTISICEVNKDLLAQMQQNLSTEPKILCNTAARSSCCIYRVPQSLTDVNGRSYQPQIVSIGPYHHGLLHLQMIEERKWRFLSLLLKRIQPKGITLVDLYKAVQPLELRARVCYFETFPFDHDQFIKILVLDGCFIIELVRRLMRLVPTEAGDPLKKPWIIYSVLSDLIQLENQIPFFVLDCLFKKTQMPDEEELCPSLPILILTFFNRIMGRPHIKVIAKYKDLHSKHILDLLRSSYCSEISPCKDDDWNMFLDETQTFAPFVQNCQVIPCVSKLRRAGISMNTPREDDLALDSCNLFFRFGQVAREEDNFLNIKFRHGVIEMPTITIDNFMCSFLMNCVAYEQGHNDSSTSMHMTAYAVFLDCLINTSRDVEYLSERNVLVNYLGSDDEAAKFINDLAKNVAFEIPECYLAGEFCEVNKHYHNNWNVQLESFKHTYFNTPWSFISALAALVLLVLTLLQTIFTILG